MTPLKTSLAVGLTTFLTACQTGQSATDRTVWRPEKPTQCDLGGWVSSPEAVTVRAQPDENAASLGTLPPMIKTPDAFHYGVELTIHGSHNGWLIISGAQDDPELSGQPARPVYSGSGWIPGSAVSFSVQSDTGYARPGATSTVVATFDGAWLTEVGDIDRVVACNGEWALLDFHRVRERNETTDILETLTPEEQAASQNRAWFRNICPVQETTCDQE